MSEPPVIPYKQEDYAAQRPCDWGSCGWCGEGKHERCWNIRGHNPPRQQPHTFILDKNGRAVGGLRSSAVYQVGYIEQWTCQCHRDGHGSAGQQLGLFGATA